jgi:hypothetical protein
MSRGGGLVLRVGTAAAMDRLARYDGELACMCVCVCGACLVRVCVCAVCFGACVCVCALRCSASHVRLPAKR